MLIFSLRVVFYIFYCCCCCCWFIKVLKQRDWGCSPAEWRGWCCWWAGRAAQNQCGHPNGGQPHGGRSIEAHAAHLGEEGGHRRRATVVVAVVEVSLRVEAVQAHVESSHSLFQKVSLAETNTGVKIRHIKYKICKRVVFRCVKYHTRKV